MPRWRTQGAHDDRLAGLRDPFFVGVDQRDPRSRPQGYAHDAVNKRFVDGVAETRLGLRTVTWGADWGVDFPIDFPFSFHECGFQGVYGVGRFSDPNSNEGGLIAVKAGVWRVAPNQEPQLIALPSGTELSDDVKFTQCFDRVLMWRGASLTPLEWNPQQDFTAGIREFVAISQSAGRNTDTDNSWGDGSVTIPNVTDGTLFNNRLFLITGRDYLTVSDILDYTRFNPVTQVFRINSGSDDRLMKVVGMNPSTLVCFKDQSIMALYNVYGALGSVVQRQITGNLGLVASEAWAYMGKDVWYLAHGHVYSLALTAENELQAEALPISEQMKTFMSRINWSAIGGAVAESHAGDFYLAAPIDGAQFNNAIAVWSGANQAWMGHWEAADFLDVKSFVKLDYAGRKRLFFVQGDSVSSSTRAHGGLFLVGEGYTDYVYGTHYDVSDKLVTRGYSAKNVENKRYANAHVDQSTWAPSFSTNLLLDGEAESYTLDSAVTKSRTAYYQWGKAAWDPTNDNDDHGDPGREDYSIMLDTGETMDPNTTGIDAGRHQRVTENYLIARNGQYCQLELLSTQGRRNIHAIEIEAGLGRRAIQVEA